MKFWHWSYASKFAVSTTYRFICITVSSTVSRTAKPQCHLQSKVENCSCIKQKRPTDTHTHTLTRLTALFPGLHRLAGTRKVKPIWILLKQETVSGSGISWTVCKSAPRSRQTTTPAPHHSVFLRVGCPSCHPTNSVKALKANKSVLQNKMLIGMNT